MGCAQHTRGLLPSVAGEARHRHPTSAAARQQHHRQVTAAGGQHRHAETGGHAARPEQQVPEHADHHCWLRTANVHPC